ncbi:hypothetical protein [Bogoriella caseilytica]|uniref:Uncharacterized protein n=1 Tax=Bogoriella caseilytica TaxID=56055 RepID=A0A3N2BC96_9MICO|nr:hypothetical protein [Bogoriella caseilytica]ROR72848.1 hypothetical protein EDD31_1208 [Bogoriella caseilytica]
MPPPPRQDRAALWVVLGLLALLLLGVSLVIVLLLSGVQSSEPTPEPTPTGAPDTTPDDETSDDEPTPEDELTSDDETSGDEPTPEDSETSGPNPESEREAATESDSRPVLRAESLAEDEAALLDTVMTIHTSPLRYTELEMFDEMYYYCLFTADLGNLSADQSVTYEMEFAVRGFPDVTWESGSPGELEPGETRELIFGWEETTPEDLQLNEQECTGAQVELTALTATTN